MGEETRKSFSKIHLNTRKNQDIGEVLTLISWFPANNTPTSQVCSSMLLNSPNTAQITRTQYFLINLVMRLSLGAVTNGLICSLAFLDLYSPPQPLVTLK